MPLYEYECFLCHHRFERIQRVDADPIRECPSCGGAVRRLLGTPALQFKGSGWYVTDYAGGRSSSTTSNGHGDGPAHATSATETGTTSSGSSSSSDES
ncbi:MAG: zinc ribbon domain-containing protein [Holophagae bacterium]|jgi:putative FmdB family regulatory protein